MVVKLLKAQKSKIIKLQLRRSVVWPPLPSGRRLILQCQMKATSCLLIQSAAAAPQLRTCQSVCRNSRRTSERRMCVSAVHQLPGSKVDKCDGFFFLHLTALVRSGGSEVTGEAFVAACSSTEREVEISEVSLQQITGDT